MLQNPDARRDPFNEAKTRASAQPFRESNITRLLMAVVLSGLVWRLVRFFSNLDMTGDEANVLRDIWPRTFAQLLQPLNFAQVLPPGFLWITKLFDSWFPNEWGVRTLPELAGIAGMVLFWAISGYVLRGAGRWLAWAIFSVSYVPIAEGACVKGYTIDPLLAMVMFWLLLRWLRGGQRPRELVWLAVCAPVFVWISYTSVFVIGAVSLVLIAYWFKNRETIAMPAIIAGLSFMALAGASALALYLVNIRPALAVSKAVGLQDFWGQGYPPVSQPWKIPIWLIEVHAGRGFAWPVGDNHYRLIVTAALWFTGLAIYWRRGSRWIWMLFVAPNILSLLAAFLHKYPYGANPRICMFLGPSVCLFMGAGAQYLLRRLGHDKRRQGYRIAAIGLLLIAVVGAARDIVLRIREIKGPDIRSTLVAAGPVAGANGQFVILPGKASAPTAYYIKRYISQPVSQLSAFKPAQARSGSNLVVMATTSGNYQADLDGFARFERTIGKPMNLIWARQAVIQPPDREPGVIVRVYNIR